MFMVCGIWMFGYENDVSINDMMSWEVWSMYISMNHLIWRSYHDPVIWFLKNYIKGINMINEEKFRQHSQKTHCLSYFRKGYRIGRRTSERSTALSAVFSKGILHCLTYTPKGLLHYPPYFWKEYRIVRCTPERGTALVGDVLQNYMSVANWW